MIHYKMQHQSIVLLALVLTTMGVATESQDPKQEGNTPPTLEIHLRDLGYQPPQECRYGGTGIPRDLSVLNDDYSKRLIFVDDKTLVVYQSHCQPGDRMDGSTESRSMEAFFVSPQTGVLISRKAWPTIKRRWLNERWDTQARIMAVQGGFLVHAGNSLVVYSSKQEEMARLPLEDGPRWAVAVAPLGDTIHLQRIQDDNQAEGEWLTYNSFKTLRNQKEAAGISSASDNAVVNKLAHCVQLQAVGAPPRNLYCADQARLGLPLYLSDSEILSVYDKGFTVFSTSGEKLWSRESTVRSIDDHERSLNGNRFALLVAGHVVYDSVSIPAKQRAVFVYDRAERTKILCVVLGRDGGRVSFELSPDGSMLAVLINDTIRVYKLPGRVAARN